MKSSVHVDRQVACKTPWHEAPCVKHTCCLVLSHEKLCVNAGTTDDVTAYCDGCLCREMDTEFPKVIALSWEFANV